MTEFEVTPIIYILSLYFFYELIMIYTATQWKKITSNLMKKNTIAKALKRYLGFEKKSFIPSYNSWVVIFSLIICTFIGYYNKTYEQLQFHPIELEPIATMDLTT